MGDFNHDADVRGLWKHGETLYSVDYEHKLGMPPEMVVIDTHTEKEKEWKQLTLKRVMSSLDQKYIVVRRWNNGNIEILQISEATYKDSIVSYTHEESLLFFSTVPNVRKIVRG